MTELGQSRTILAPSLLSGDPGLASGGSEWGCVWALGPLVCGTRAPSPPSQASAPHATGGPGCTPGPLLTLRVFFTDGAIGGSTQEQGSLGGKAG